MMGRQRGIGGPRFVISRLYPPWKTRVSSIGPKVNPVPPFSAVRVDAMLLIGPDCVNLLDDSSSTRVGHKAADLKLASEGQTRNAAWISILPTLRTWSSAPISASTSG